MSNGLKIAYGVIIMMMSFIACILDVIIGFNTSTFEYAIPMLEALLGLFFFVMGNVGVLIMIDGIVSKE